MCIQYHKFNSAQLDRLQHARSADVSSSNQYVSPIINYSLTKLSTNLQIFFENIWMQFFDPDKVNTSHVLFLLVVIALLLITCDPCFYIIKYKQLGMPRHRNFCQKSLRFMSQCHDISKFHNWLRSCYSWNCIAILVQYQLINQQY